MQSTVFAKNKNDENFTTLPDHYDFIIFEVEGF